jgi:RHS repeat-associated protein
MTMGHAMTAAAREASWIARAWLILVAIILAVSGRGTAYAASPCPPAADMRGDCSQGAPPSNVPRPVNVHTGNVWFDQTDALVPGLGAPLVVSRSYNSKNAYENVRGAFGRGWSHAYEQRVIVLAQEGIISLRKGDGVAIHYQDIDEDGIYRATVPITEESWIELVDGNFLRRFPSGRVETYAGATGYWLAYTDAAGNQTVLNRDIQGRLSAIMEPGGRSLSFSYEGDLISEVTGPLGRIATYVYHNGLLDRVSYPNGEGYEFTYDAFGQVLALRDGSGRVLERHEYVDGKGVTSEIDGGQERYALAFGEAVTTVTDARGYVTTYEYHHIWGRNHVTRIVHPGAETEEWSYDDRGRVTSHKNRSGQTTRYEYDSRGRLAAVVNDLGHRTTTTYDALGRPDTDTTPDGVVQRITYGPFGPTEVRLSSGAATRMVRIEYDSRGLISRTTDAGGKSTQYSYSDSGDLLAVTDLLGHTTRYTYDAVGRRISAADAMADAASAVMEYTYDVRGRVLTVRHTKHAGAPMVTNTYDLGGRLIERKDAFSRTTTYTYDFAGRLETMTDSGGGVSRFAYDAMSNRTSLADSMNRVTLFEYDANARLVAASWPGEPRPVERWVYDSGRLSRRIDRKGVVTTFSYDALGRLVRESFSDGTAPVSYGYDVMGRVIVAANDIDTLRWTHDPLGQVATESSSKNGAVVSYAYDASGRRAAVGLNGTAHVGYGYDDGGRLVRITGDAGSFLFGYDTRFRRVSVLHPNQLTTRYQYDDLGRLSNVGIERSGDVVEHVSYTYDAAGSLLSKASTQYSEFYRYDDLLRLTEVRRPHAGESSVFGYDAAGNRRYDALDGQVVLYEYDERNQLVRRTTGLAVRVAGAVDEPAEVSINQQAPSSPAQLFSGIAQVAATGGRIDIAARDAAGNVAERSYQVPAPSSESEQYEYDENGRLVRRIESSGTWTYQWDARDQLVRVARDGVEVARFVYDALGRRVEKVVGGVTTTYLYEGQDILRERRASATGTQVLLYVHGPGLDEPLAKKDATTGAATYYHADGLGSVVKHSDGAGNIVETYRYGAWGDIEAGASVQGHAFTGREWDAETGLYYYRARYYDPKLGRFLSEDPLGPARGNAYLYALNNPTGYIDSDGHEAATATAGAIALGATAPAWALPAAIVVTGAVAIAASWQIGEYIADTLYPPPPLTSGREDDEARDYKKFEDAAKKPARTAKDYLPVDRTQAPTSEETLEDITKTQTGHTKGGRPDRITNIEKAKQRFDKDCKK